MEDDFFASVDHQSMQFVYAGLHSQSFLQTPFLAAVDVVWGCLLICVVDLDYEDYSLNSFPFCK